jgi:hydrogenase nickel incorporation protein HypB
MTVALLLIATALMLGSIGKDPKMFRTSQAMVISKSDLLPHVPFSVDAAIADARLIQPDLSVSPVCSLTGDGIAAWCEFLDDAR